RRTAELSTSLGPSTQPATLPPSILMSDASSCAFDMMLEPSAGGVPPCSTDCRDRCGSIDLVGVDRKERVSRLDRTQAHPLERHSQLPLIGIALAELPRGACG